MKKIVFSMCVQCGSLVGNKQVHGKAHSVFGSFINFEVEIPVTKRKKKVDRD